MKNKKEEKKIKKLIFLIFSKISSVRIIFSQLFLYYIKIKRLRNITTGCQNYLQKYYIILYYNLLQTFL